MSLNVRVAVDLGEARRIVGYLRNLGEHPGPLLDIAGGILENSTRDRFRTSSGPGGIPWPTTWRQRYQAAPGEGGKDTREALGPNPGGRPLIDTGGLLSSLTHIADDHRVEVGIIAKTESAKFAYVQQFGAMILPKRGQFLVFTAPGGHKIFARSVTIPARPFIGVDDVDRADLNDAWLEYLRSRFK